jgi:hypothetical protein
MGNKSLQIYVNGEEKGISTAMEETTKFAVKQQFDKKEALCMRLITEELLGLFSGITNNDYRALFWVEGGTKEAIFHLIAKTDMTAEKRNQFIEASTSKKNDAAVGIMGKIKDMVETAVLNFGNINGATSEFYDAGVTDNAPIDGLSLFWTLENYRKSMEAAGSAEEEEDGWDELERSIIANIADDVHVSIRKDSVEIVVFKKF